MDENTHLDGLAALAAWSIRDTLTPQHPAHKPPPEPGWDQPGASFVTLRADSRLRGCVGSLHAWRALDEDVADNALGAAFRDPRFAALEAGELGNTTVEVSVLSTPEPLARASRGSLLDTLVPQRDGLTVRADEQRATFLPAVWSQLPEPERFLDALLAKAGIARDYDFTRLSFERYLTTHSRPLALAG